MAVAPARGCAPEGLRVHRLAVGREHLLARAASAHLAGVQPDHAVAVGAHLREIVGGEQEGSTVVAQPAKGVDYIPVTLSTGLNPLDVYNEGNGGKPWPYHVNIYELEKRNAGKKGFTQEAMRANRARSSRLINRF